MILVVFHTAGINEKKIYIIIMNKKKFGTEPGWATAQVSLRPGWVLGTGRASVGRVGTAHAAWARWCGAHEHWGGRRWGAGAAGAGAAGAGAAGAGAAGAGAAGAGAGRARWEWQAWAHGAQASGRAERHDMAPGAPRQLGRRAHGRAQPARGHGMDAQGREAGARGAAGWEACVRLVCAAGPGWVFCCT